MTDILDLPGWKAVETRRDGDEYVIEAEHPAQPTACQKCGVIGGLYKHGPQPVHIRDSPIRGRPVRILVKAQRYRCRECGGTFIQPLGSVHPETRMTVRCVHYIQEQCLRDTFLRIAEHIGCDDKTIRNLAGDYIAQRSWAAAAILFRWEQGAVDDLFQIGRVSARGDRDAFKATHGGLFKLFQFSAPSCVFSLHGVFLALRYKTLFSESLAFT